MNKFTKFLTMAALSCAIVLPVAACGGGRGGATPKDNIVEDTYDNYYEVFVYSYNDSDGKDVGDFKGVTEKLDYIRDMGYTGIWLMPINPTGSYHGYDVRDYKAVNSRYGTMEDFQELVDTAHEKGIKVIIDLVLNHSSNQHPWFKNGLKAFYDAHDPQYPDYDPDTDPNAKYANYYNFSMTQPQGATVTYRSYKVTGTKSGGSVWAEANFDQAMPDVNLECPDIKVEYEDIINFWIKDHKVDGFRLDAVRYFYYGDAKSSAEFTGWIKETADKAIRERTGDPNASSFVVGEDWSGASELEIFFENAKGASFFDFQSAGAGGYVGGTLNDMLRPDSADPSGAANYFYGTIEKVINKAHGNVASPFLCNHDQGRIAGQLAKDELKIKLAYGLLSMYSGNIFTYYGDEIGMCGDATDPDKRVGMRWENDTKSIFPPGTFSKEPKDFYPFGSVEQQLEDPDSILNYYKLCNQVRNAFPALMRGTPERIENDNENVLVFKKTYKDETVTVAINFSNSKQTVKNIGAGLKLQHGICVEGKASGNGSSLKLPAFGIAILK